jgi:reductive dehalogenase
MDFKHIDERDTIFARMSYKKGTIEYEKYYSENPDKKEIDDKLRNLQGLLSEKSPTYDKKMAAMTKANFHLLNELKSLNNEESYSNKFQVENQSKFIKGYGKMIGASEIRITKTKNHHYYKYKGRNNKFGQKIEKKYKYAIVIAVEMDKNMINRAPQAEEVLEVSYGYFKGAIIGFLISYFLKHLGYNSKNHFDGDYDVVLSYLAKDSGIGQIGRNGLVTNKKIGNRMRLGAVTTDAELETDESIDFGLEEFCDKCKKCANNCPSKAISKKSLKDKSFLYSFNPEQCYETWHKFGTDCGICISSCPFSQEIPFDFDYLDQKTTEKILNWDREKNGRRNYLDKNLF